ncbi:MAG: amidohydrolase family protein, partial [Sphaerochaetaceae bacterium]|nr:amidohydrolase family protein [Sphaerochaetaceae bacterium]
AKIFGIYPNKGSLEINSDADLIIFDPSEVWTLQDDNVHSASLYTPYRDFEVKGRVKLTMLRGNIIVEDGQYYGKPGFGCFVEQS